ncbi:uncharacterized protein LOC111598698 [Drosophila hydei]|uniref:Uncharacterized protein LOC111598698 n=1 Tax=Drosophila hydei TaxID=7224 RepID=A0A6J1LS98_DROHY|nr:uncharacterized protein LOC111598698 [Drosophila hydei]
MRSIIVLLFGLLCCFSLAQLVCSQYDYFSPDYDNDGSLVTTTTTTSSGGLAPNPAITPNIVVTVGPSNTTRSPSERLHRLQKLRRQRRRRQQRRRRLQRERLLHKLNLELKWGLLVI